MISLMMIKTDGTVYNPMDEFDSIGTAMETARKRLFPRCEKCLGKGWAHAAILENGEELFRLSRKL